MRYSLLSAAMAAVVAGSLPTNTIADDLYACFHKENGKLRVVSSHDKCKRTEVPVTLATIGQQLELQCVTGELYYIVSDVPAEPPYCTDEFSLQITSPEGTDLVAADVFDVLCDDLTRTDGEGEVQWGLQCKAGWQNTGCTGSSFSSGSGEIDIAQFSNGCYSDDEEYGNANVFTTCCRVW